MRTRDILALAAHLIPGLLGGLACGAADAQEWPSKPIRIVVAYPAGSAADAMTRVLVTRMAVTLGQPLIVDNRPGANANIGIEAAARSAADGYTLLTSGGYVITNPMQEPNLRWRTEDLAPVARFTVGVNFVVVPASLPVKSLPEFIDHAKKNPGLPFADAGAAAPQTLGLQMLTTLARLEVLQVSYKGGPAIVPDLINGSVKVAILPLNVALASLRAGKLTALANPGEKRSVLFPDVPTLAEQGFDGATVVSWQGFHVPAGTPGEVVKRLAKAVGEAASAEEVRTRTEGAGGEIAFLDTDEFKRFLAEDEARWRNFMKTIPQSK